MHALPVRLLVRSRAVLVILVVLSMPLQPSRAADTLDFDLPSGIGHFYRQANGRGGEGDAGYAVTNAGGIPFWDEYRRLGGPDVLGYPVSHRFVWDGFVVQAVQKVVFQWEPSARRVRYVNLLDRMHDLGRDDWLQIYRQIPPPFDTSADQRLAWNQVVGRHLAFLDQNPAIRARYWADPSPIEHFGLPMGYDDMGNVYVIRAQRAVFQHWKEDVPWASRGTVTIANGGDLAKEAGFFPSHAITPTPPPELPASGTRSHDWRVPGFVSAVGGQVFDPYCVPLRSVGTNVPNLAYRDGLDAHLEWMRTHRLRWMRVFATGHSLGSDRAPQDARRAADALGSLLSRVEVYNASHDPAEAIYVLVSLTDYYPPGVPGDRHAFDHPTFRESPVLPAPWFRPDVHEFDFDQEHDAGRLAGLPNYEMHYKPWVREMVSRLAQSRVLLGWQLGNELKARGSPRNGIGSAEAYDWYLAFTRDMVDAIRAVDRNHPIFVGAQYIGELTDWEYRPKDHLDQDRVPEYRRLATKMLDACGEYCWNVWSLTAYDFNPYALDDAETFGRAGVAVVVTEYGFTRGTLDEMDKRFGGDRAAAVRDGLARSWEDLHGNIRSRFPSAGELVQTGLVDGIAPWGSPAPGPWSSFDTDGSRGVTGSPDEEALWTAWSEVAASLGGANRGEGTSSACLTLHSSPPER